MAYVQGMVIPVRLGDKDAYRAHAEAAFEVFRDYGALQMVHLWGVDVPEGKGTDFSKAVRLEPDETVVMAWTVWTDKAARDAGWERMRLDPRMGADRRRPFDLSRMIVAGFEPMFDSDVNWGGATPEA